MWPDYLPSDPIKSQPHNPRSPLTTTKEAQTQQEQSPLHYSVCVSGCTTQMSAFRLEELSAGSYWLSWRSDRKNVREQFGKLRLMWTEQADMSQHLGVFVGLGDQLSLETLPGQSGTLSPCQPAPRHILTEKKGRERQILAGAWREYQYKSEQYRVHSQCPSIPCRAHCTL